MVQIIKRDGRTVDFDKTKIVKAVLKAFAAVDGELTDYAISKAEKIADYIETASENETLTIESIQDLVENGLMATKRRDVARAYIKYRENRNRARANPVDKTIEEICTNSNEYWSTENSNKNPQVVTTQRDYIAGAISTDIARRKLLPFDVVEAHDRGEIHFHDMDYFVQNALTNCFRGDEKFISSDGVRSFCSYTDGAEIYVPTHTGEWKKAIVKKYGVKKLNKVTLKRGSWTEKTVYVTPNHRWILKDGSVTTNLKVGDYLLKTPVINDFDWEDLTTEEKLLWAKGFAYGDGRAIQFAHSWYTDIRLCGKKNQYIPNFREAGLKITFPNNLKGDASVKIPGYNKNEIPPNMSIEETKIFIYGYLCADGSRTSKINNSNTRNEFKMLQVTGNKKVDTIYDLLNKAGYYVSKIDDLTGTTTNYGQRTDITKAYYFQANQTYRNWRVVAIEPSTECETWCLEVEDNHSFILEKGIVTGNCELVNLDDMLQNGTVINGKFIRKPHRILTASTISTQIILAVTSSTYGGCTITLSHLAPFVRDSYKRFLKKYLDFGLTKDQALQLADIDIKKEVEDAVQTFNYQVNSMTNTNGQSPFLSVCMYLGETTEYKKELAMLIEEFLKQRIQGFQNEQGQWITPEFPKLLYIMEEDNMSEDAPYWYLTELAAECAAKRMVPDFISEKIMKMLKIDANGNGQCYPCMGCRSFLTPYINEKGQPQYYGRFNQGVVTVNLVDIALSSNKDMDKFWEIFEQRTELCHKALRVRHERIKGITSDAAPILWQHGAFARLKPGESVEKLLYGGYSTLSLGYAGLYECVKYMTGYSHTGAGKDFGLQVMKKLNEKTAQWKEVENIAYSLYGSPIESTTYKFAKALKEKFGIVEGITDRNYITNSYH